MSDRYLVIDTTSGKRVGGHGLKPSTRAVLALGHALPGVRGAGWRHALPVAAATIGVTEPQWVPVPWWAWFLLALLAAAIPTLHPHTGRRYYSDREATYVTAIATATGTTWLLGYPHASLPAWLAFTATWWWSRRVRAAHAAVKLWLAIQATDARFAGIQLQPVDMRMVKGPRGNRVPDGEATLTVPRGATAQDVVPLGPAVESHLDLMPGQVTITRAPSNTTRQAVLLITRHEEAAVSRYSHGPTLDRDGSFILSTRGRVTHRARFGQRGGAANFALVGGGGSGKGGTARLIGYEAAMSPLIVTLVLDGKKGAGVPYLRPGVDAYASTPAQWDATLDAVEELAELRQARHRREGRDQWAMRAGDPLIHVLADEWWRIATLRPRFVSRVEQLTATDRSLGIGKTLVVLRGDGAGWGGDRGPGLRSLMYANGQAWIGPAGDTHAAAAAVQDYGVNPASLPGAPGWGYLCTRSGGVQQRTDLGRTLWLPNRHDVEMYGDPAPEGVIEDRLRDAVKGVHAMQDEEAAVIHRLLERLAELGDGAGERDRDDVADAGDATLTDVDGEVLTHLVPAGEVGLTPNQLLGHLPTRNRQHLQARLGVLRDRGAIRWQGRTGRVTQTRQGAPYVWTEET